MTPSLDYLADGTGAEERPAAAKIGDYVSVLDYIPASEHAAMKAGTSTYDASSDYQAAVDANKGGRIVHPAGYTIIAAGTALSGSTYNGTSLLIEGAYKLAPSGGSTNFGGSSPFWGGIILHDCENIVVDVPGLMDGNRSNQAANEQHHCLTLRGARNVAIPTFRAKEVRGDGITITSATNLSPLTTNASGIAIGTVQVWNSADDGRNALSIVSGVDIEVDSVLSTKVGGVISSARMPGGVDIETDGAWHLVKHVRIGRIVVETAGATGVAILGQSLTGSDAAEDWNVQDVEIGDFSLVSSSDSTALFRRARNLRIAGSVEQGSRGIAAYFDYLNGVEASVRTRGVTNGAMFGLEGWVRDFDVSASVADYNGAAVVAVGLDKGRLRSIVRKSTQAAGTYMLQIADAGRTITQQNVHYDVDFPNDVVSAAVLCGATGGGSIAVGTDTFLTGLIGVDPAYQFGGAVVPTRNIEGRNFGTSAPSAGLWLRGERILNTTPSAGGTPGWVCTTSGTAGSTAVFKAMANLAS